MDKGFLPLFIDIKQLRIIVIGAGTIAERKVNKLLYYEATPTIIAPHITSHQVQDWIDAEVVDYIEGSISSSTFDQYLQGASLVIAATDNKELNKEIAKYCMGNKILINNITSPKDCNTRFSAEINEKDLQIAISTKGKSPSRAVKIRNEILKEIAKN